jgi:hypothetical protein
MRYAALRYLADFKAGWSLGEGQPEEPKRKQHYLFKSITTDQYGHFDLRGLAPGKYKLFSWDGVEQGEWEDTDFLKDSEEKGVTVDLKGSDIKAIELKLIQLKNTAMATE